MYCRRIIIVFSCSVLSTMLIVISGSAMGNVLWSVSVYALGVTVGVLGLLSVLRMRVDRRRDSAFLARLGALAFVVTLLLAGTLFALSDLPVKWRWAVSQRSFEELRAEVLLEDGDLWVRDERTSRRCLQIGERVGFFHVVEVCRASNGLQFVVGWDSWGQPRGFMYGRGIAYGSDQLVELDDDWFLWRSYK